MTLRLQNKVAIITGAGRGIGKAIALGFAREGASIVGVARTLSELDSLAMEVRRFGGRILNVFSDLSDPSQPRRIVLQTLSEFDTIDVLVNNAAVGTEGCSRPVVDFDDDYWSLSLATNLTAPYLMCRAVLPTLLKKRRGAIINISSLAGRAGLVNGVAYSATKHGLLGITRTLAMEVAKDGIAVNAICPGSYRTEMNQRSLEQDSIRLGIDLQSLEKKIAPIGRRLDPTEIVPTALLLAQTEGVVITGQAINVCGGRSLFREID